jgi:hypothetical protein
MSDRVSERGWPQPSRPTLTFVTHAREKKIDTRGEGTKGFLLGSDGWCLLSPHAKKAVFLGQKELRGSCSCMLGFIGVNVGTRLLPTMHLSFSLS